MRYQYACYGMLLLLTDVAYCGWGEIPSGFVNTGTSSAPKQSANSIPKQVAQSSSNQKTPKNTPASTKQPINKAANPPQSLGYYFHQFNEKNLYINATALYAIMSDGGLNNSPFAEITSPNGDNTNYNPSVNPGWGYQVQLGYKLDPTATHTLTATYSSITTSGTTTVNAESGGYLINDFTQLGAGATPGFHLMSGPATAIGKLSYGYQNLNLAARRPYSDDGGTTIKFYRDLSVRFTHLNKNFQGQYNGLVTGINGLESAQDNVSYSANYYGIGPQLLYEAIWAVTTRIKLKGGGAGAALAGFYTSELNESATATGPVQVSTILTGLSSYTDHESHPTQAWTPAVFETHFSVLIDLLNKPAQGRSLSIEGGIFLETILPLSTNDSINQNLGQQLDKLNNNLNMSGVFITLNAGLD